MPFQRLAAAVFTRLPGAVSILLLRRGFSSSASRPPWAMIQHTKIIRSPARLVSIELAEPPCASPLVVPDHIANCRRRFHPNSEILGVLRGAVRATSGDGFVLLDFKGGFDDVERDISRALCNPLSGELFRLPDIGGTKKTMCCEGFGLLTQSELPRARAGPPDRYAVAVLSEDHDGKERCFLMRRFLSQTGEWEKLVGLPSPLPLARQLMDVGHEVLAFDGRLWWVDVSWGAVSVDPFSDRPDLRFVELPRGRMTGPVAPLRVLGRYRRMGVSEGRLRYAEMSEEEDCFVLSSFSLDDDGSGWTLEHRVPLGHLWTDGGRPGREDMPRIGVIDPLNANVVYLTIGNVAVAVDMEAEKALRCSRLDEGMHPQFLPSAFLIPCVLPPWLESSNVPSGGTPSKSNVRTKTLADVLVRLDRDKKN